MTKRLRELLLLVGSLGLAFEVVVQGGQRPEVMTAMISLLATAGALKADEARKDTAPAQPAAQPPDGHEYRAIKIGDRWVMIDSDGNVVED